MLGPNARFFAAHGVRGLFEQGCYTTRGGEFDELRAWVLAKLLWNPADDDRALIREFVDGYYGPAAPWIAEYLNLLHDTTEKIECSLPCAGPPVVPYLTPEVLTQAESLFQKAEAAVGQQPDILRRVQLAHASVQYAVLSTWPVLRNKIEKQGRPWPFGSSHRDMLKQFCKVCRENGVVRLSEGDATPPAEFFRRALDVVGPHGGIAPPELCKNLKDTDWADIQESQITLALGKWVEVRDDKAASNGRAAWMPATHTEWAVQLPIPLGLWMDHADAAVDGLCDGAGGQKRQGRRNRVRLRNL